MDGSDSPQPARSEMQSPCHECCYTAPSRISPRPSVAASPCRYSTLPGTRAAAAGSRCPSHARRTSRNCSSRKPALTKVGAISPRRAATIVPRRMSVPGRSPKLAATIVPPIMREPEWGPELAEHDNHAAAHPVAEALAGTAADDEEATSHARHVAGDRAAGESARVLPDPQRSARHPCARKRAGVAVDGERTSPHAEPRPLADIAFDADLANAHCRPDAVKAARPSGNVYPMRIAQRDVEHVAEEAFGAGRADRQPRDFPR